MFHSLRDPVAPSLRDYFRNYVYESVGANGVKVHQSRLDVQIGVSLGPLALVTKDMFRRHSL